VTQTDTHPHFLFISLSNVITHFQTILLTVTVMSSTEKQTAKTSSSSATETNTNTENTTTNEKRSRGTSTVSKGARESKTIRSKEHKRKRLHSKSKSEKMKPRTSQKVILHQIWFFVIHKRFSLLCFNAETLSVFDSTTKYSLFSCSFDHFSGRISANSTKMALSCVEKIIIGTNIMSF
jgi:hypothetical protein